MAIALSRRKFLSLAAGAGAAAVTGGLGVWAWFGRSEGLQEARSTGWALGAEVTLLALHRRRAAAQEAVEAAFGELARVERVMSLYRPDSQLVRLNRDGVLEQPDADLVAALRTAGEMSLRSGGAFDATVQPLWTAYAQADRRGSLPEASAVEEALGRVGWQGVDVTAGRIRLARPGMAVTLNGIAQGLAADRVLAVLGDHGVEHALVNTGEIGSMGRKSDGRPWTVGVQHPRRPEEYVALASLDGRCMATSGDYETRFGEGFDNNHIFDPATGQSPTAFSSVTVLADRGVDADAISTAVFVMGPEKGLQLVRSTPRADAMLVFKDGRTLATEGFPGAKS